jgi:adenylate cyclase
MSPHVKAVLLGVFVGVAGLIASPFELTLGLEENAGLGLLFKLRGERPAPADIVVVSIDRESSEHLDVPDNPDKWPRSLHARLTDTLAGEGASVIAFDLHFIEPRSPDDDALFAESIGRAGSVVLVEPLKAKDISLPGGDGSPGASHSIVQLVPPVERFSRPAAASAPFILPRIPFKVNKYWTFETRAGDSPTMPVVALQLFAMEAYEEFVHLLERASPNHAGRLPRTREAAMADVKATMQKVREIFRSDPLIAGRMREELERSGSGEARTQRMVKSLVNVYAGVGNRYLNYYGPPGSIITIPYHQILQPSGEAWEKREIDLEGKAVFVGLSEVLLAERKDSFYTVFSQAGGVFIGGVEIAATAFANLLTDTPVRPIGLSTYILVILLWGILLGVFCRMSSLWIAALGTIVLSGIYLFAAAHRFETGFSWYPVVVPLFFQAPVAYFGALIWNYIDVNRERENVRVAFEHHLPKEVVDQLAKDVAHIQTGSRVVHGICLFTDAQNYTTLSETLEPQDLGALMNSYYERIFGPVKENEGFVSAIIGDAMLALWAGKVSERSFNNNACAAAVDINRELCLAEKSSHSTTLTTRIGIHCGQIFLGHIGALDHYQYTPMGDIVNTAARIEGLNKHLGTKILISEEMTAGLDGFLTRELGRFKLKGKLRAIGIHELGCRIEDSDERQRNAYAIFAEALDAFRQKSWDEARSRFSLSNETIVKFNLSNENLGEDGPSLFYLRLCERYRVETPDESWDGLVRMDSK